jgi:hypothetical protein
VKAAVVSTAIYGVAILFFALTSSYLLALALLLIGGIANLASMSIGQTIVQLLALRPTAAGSSACTACRPTACGPGAGSPSASSAPPSASTGHSASAP